MYSVFEEVLHEADLKYIGILLNYGLSVEKIAKRFWAWRGSTLKKSNPKSIPKKNQTKNWISKIARQKTQSRKSFSCYFCLFFFIPGNPAGRHYLFILSLRIHIYTIFQKKYAFIWTFYIVFLHIICIQKNGDKN